MLAEKKLISLRNRGAAIVSGLTTLAVTGSTAMAVSSAQNGLTESVNKDNQTADLFGDNSLFETVVNLLLFLVGAISVIMLIIGGIRYILSAGDQQKVTDAKNTIMYAVIGIVLAVLAWAIVNFLLSWLYTGTKAIG